MFKKKERKTVETGSFTWRELEQTMTNSESLQGGEEDNFVMMNPTWQAKMKGNYINYSPQ